MMKKVFLLAFSVVLAACHDGKSAVAPLELESNGSTATGTGPEGGMDGVESKIGTPAGVGEPGRGELGIFDLRGPVRECKWKNADGVTTYTFDADGYWLAKNGTAIIGGVFPGSVDRNKNGRIAHGYLDEYKETQHEFTYNNKGLVTMINYQDYMDGGYVEEFTYDADGYVKSVKSYYTGMDAVNEETGEADEQPTVRNYTILEKDDVGNWTKRKSSQGIETRTIKYY